MNFTAQAFYAKCFRNRDWTPTLCVISTESNDEKGSSTVFHTEKLQRKSFNKPIYSTPSLPALNGRSTASLTVQPAALMTDRNSRSATTGNAARR